jgi:hypothetical protein
MRESARFALIPRARSDEPARSELVVDGNASGVWVDGVRLEAQFDLEDGTAGAGLILTTDDTPFEEYLHIYLLAGNGHVVEKIDRGNMYTPGIVENVRVVSSHELQFDFRGPQRLLVGARPKGLFRRRRMELIEVEEEQIK